MRGLLIVLLLFFSSQAFTQDLNMQDGTFNRCAPDKFYDSGGQGDNYSSNENLVTTICPESDDELIVIDFLSFNTQLNVDVLTIYDGNSTSAPIIGTYSGVYIPETITPSESNPSGCLTFQFISNESGTTSGWEAEIFCGIICQDIVASIDSTMPEADVDGNVYVTLGDQINFTGNAEFSDDGSAALYEWDFGDTNTASGTSVSHLYLDVGAYEVTFKVSEPNQSDIECSSSDVINVIVICQDVVASIDSVVPEEDEDGNIYIVLGDQINFSGSATFSEDASNALYQWDFGDGNSGTGETVSHAYNEYGTFEVTFTVSFTNLSNLSCSSSEVINIIVVDYLCQDIIPTIESIPEANTLGNLNVLPGNQIDLIGSATFSGDGSSAIYEWDFGDGNTATGVSVTHTYAEVGEFEITFTVTDPNPTLIDCSYSQVIDVFVTTSEIIDFPDFNFKNYLLNCNSCMDNDLVGNSFSYSIDTNFDGEISQQEASQVARLNVRDENITSMEGIEYFVNLVTLEVLIGWSGYNDNNDIDNLDLSSNINLEYVRIDSREPTFSQLSNGIYMTNHQTVGLNTINIANCIKLKTLIVWYQDLDDLDFSQSSYPDLGYINVRTNGLETIDFGTNEFTSLKSLYLQDNNIVSPITLNVPPTNNMLTHVNFDDSDLPSFEIPVGDYPLLETLNLYNNEITDISSINESTFPLLTNFNIGNNEGIADVVVSNMPSLVDFDCRNNVITSLDVSNNLNLETINADFNDISSLNLGTISNLTSLRVGINELNELDVSNLSLLEFLGCFDNNLTVLDVSQNTNLRELNASYNYLTVLDMSQNGILKELYVTNNQLLYLNLKNGSNLEVDCCEGYCQCVYRFGITGNPDLSYVCIDITNYTGWLLNEIDWVTEAIEDAGLVNCVIGGECPFIPDGEFYALEGNNKLNTDLDECLESDYSVPNLKFSIDNSAFNGDYISNQTGSYSIPLIQGEFVITPELENPDYFTVSPSSVAVEFPDQTSPIIQDFCITPTDNFNDLEILISPINQAIPGFNSWYKISYKNVGTTSLSGNLSFDFSDDSNYMTFLSSVPTENINTNNILTWNYSDLAPFEEREMLLEFNLNTPTDSNFPLNSGHELNFNVSIIHTQTDETPDNNVFDLKQIVVNSLDPNDISCLEGETILPEHVGKYVHYIIRFENVGTANATNVVIIDYIDETKFDVSTLIPLDGSHEYYTRIDEGNQVKFVFEDINLPFDDANNDGYVVFKIKTLETLVLGDTFSNQAEIYFDFNAPIITNTYSTEVSEDQLSTTEFDVLNTKIYPNPVTNILTIESQAVLKSATVFDINGRAILSSQFEDARYQMDLSALHSGIYFLKVFSNTGNETLKIVKK